MLTLGIETIVVLLLIMGAACALGGYAYAQARQRNAGGGKTAAELKTELNDYKGDVTEHFQTTANLLHDMTEQYRAVYEHMAAGAQNLCDTEGAAPQIESLRAGLLVNPAVVDAQASPPVEADSPAPEPQAQAQDIAAPSSNADDALDTVAADAAQEIDAAAAVADTPESPGGETTAGEPEVEKKEAAAQAHGGTVA